jgi:hypothetical protein
MHKFGLGYHFSVEEERTFAHMSLLNNKTELSLKVVKKSDYRITKPFHQNQ